MRELLKHSDTGILFIVSAPAGTGKTTLVQMLMNEFPSIVGNISYTTRKPRLGEVPGVHYHFISVEEFEQRIAANEFLEYAQIYGNYYGTTFQSVYELQRQCKHVVLVIDTQGAMQLKGRAGTVFIFLEPPSLDVLRERLSGRKTEEAELIELRLEWAKTEMEAMHIYDYRIMNDDLATAYQILRSIVIAETYRIY